MTTVVEPPEAIYKHANTQARRVAFEFSDIYLEEARCERMLNGLTPRYYTLMTKHETAYDIFLVLSGLTFTPLDYNTKYFDLDRKGKE